MLSCLLCAIHGHICQCIAIHQSSNIAACILCDFFTTPPCTQLPCTCADDVVADWHADNAAWHGGGGCLTWSTSPGKNCHRDESHTCCSSAVWHHLNTQMCPKACIAHVKNAKKINRHNNCAYRLAQTIDCSAVSCSPYKYGA